MDHKTLEKVVWPWQLTWGQTKLSRAFWHQIERRQMDHKTLEFIAAGRRTKRYHAGVNMFDHQRVDAHSHGVAMLVWFLMIDYPPIPRDRVLRAALVHDLPEAHTGDIPAPFKRESGMRKTFQDLEVELLREAKLLVSLKPHEERFLSLADSAEGCLHCIEEVRMGNQGAKPMLLKFWSYLHDELEIGDGPQEVRLRNHIEDQMVDLGVL